MADRPIAFGGTSDPIYGAHGIRENTTKKAMNNLVCTASGAPKLSYSSAAASGSAAASVKAAGVQTDSGSFQSMMVSRALCELAVFLLRMIDNHFLS